jgi:hypothetical protein
VDLFTDRWASGQHRDALIGGLRALRDYFCDHEQQKGYLQTGPVSVARFLGLPEGSEEAILEQREVSGMVAHFLGRLVERGIPG